MASLGTRPSRYFTALGIVFGALTAVLGTGFGDILYVVAMAATGRLDGRSSRARSGTNGVSWSSSVSWGSVYLVANLTSSDAPAYEAVLPALFALMGTLCIIAAIGIVLGRRRNGIADGVVGDALIVGLGGWILSWVLLVQPVLASTTTSIPAAVLFGFTQPTACVLLFMMATLIFTRLERPPALWLLTTALFCSIVGDLVYALMNVGHLGLGAERYGTAIYVVGVLPGDGRHSPSDDAQRHRRPSGAGRDGAVRPPDRDDVRVGDPDDRAHRVRIPRHDGPDRPGGVRLHPRRRGHDTGRVLGPGERARPGRAGRPGPIRSADRAPEPDGRPRARRHAAQGHETAVR